MYVYVNVSENCAFLTLEFVSLTIPLIHWGGSDGEREEKKIMKEEEPVITTFFSELFPECTKSLLVNYYY